jgi:HSP20 family protein
MLMRTDPFRDFDRLVDQALRPQLAVMPMDAYRERDRYVARFDLPGIDPSAIELTVEKNILTVAAERRWDTEGLDVLASERQLGRISRQLYLGDGVDTEHVQASYERGVLTVTIPVSEHAKARRIAIGTGPSNAQAIEAKSTAA